MNKKVIIDKFYTNSARLTELANAAEAENREFTDQEKAEIRSIERENSIYTMKLRAMEAEALKSEEKVDMDAMLREAMANGRHDFTISLEREIQTSTVGDSTGILRVDQQEMLKPIRAGLIYDLVGIDIRSGLMGSTLRWPIHGKATAYWRKEGDACTATSIDFNKLKLVPEGLSAAVPVTRESLEGSGGVVEAAVREELPAAVVDAINAAMFTTVGTYTDGSDTVNKPVVGPFVNLNTSNKVTCAAATPTRAELLKVKAAVAKKLGRLVAPAWVMTEDMKAQLEDVKVDAGSGRFLCENGMILGYPVFTTPYIEAKKIGFGDWSYQAAGFFGGLTVSVDPYTLLRKNETDFVLHTQFGTVTLEKDAFALATTN